jgi:cytochrome b561
MQIDLPNAAHGAARYTRTAIALHWLMAVMIIAALTLGTVLSEMAFSPLKLKLISWHKWLGVTVFGLILVRLIWRLTHTPPALPNDIAAWQRRLSAVVHGLLYGLLLTIPVSGWLYSSSAGVPTVWLGLVPLPDLLPRNEAVADVLKTVHVWLNWTLLGLVSAHTAAALHHHYVLKDGLLRRMRPYWRR